MTLCVCTTTRRDRAELCWTRRHSYSEVGCNAFDLTNDVSKRVYDDSSPQQLCLIMVMCSAPPLPPLPYGLVQDNRPRRPQGTLDVLKTVSRFKMQVKRVIITLFAPYLQKRIPGIGNLCYGPFKFAFWKMQFDPFMSARAMKTYLYWLSQERCTIPCVYWPSCISDPLVGSINLLCDKYGFSFLILSILRLIGGCDGREDNYSVVKKILATDWLLDI